MNLQMEVYDVPFCDFVQWTPLGITVRRIRRNRNLFAYVLPLYTEFYETAVHTKDPYEPLDPALVTRIEQRVGDLYTIEKARIAREIADLRSRRSSQ